MKVLSVGRKTLHSIGRSILKKLGQVIPEDRLSEILSEPSTAFDVILMLGNLDKKDFERCVVTSDDILMYLNNNTTIRHMSLSEEVEEEFRTRQEHFNDPSMFVDKDSMNIKTWGGK